ncbi:glycosyltransferase [Acinetobacter towneri]|uniref:glycosyltransferase n=1 Tax=Acinetobacter towneri TaxID=202956 RepID=UPI001CE22CE5|nr:glycosyltransferase [Acinetobacter towneri]MCA4797966.1 glycosyltransferase [Acinetobacter towneri]
MIVLHAAETIKGGVATVINSLVDYQVEQEEIDELICLVPSDQADNLLNTNNLQIFQFQRKGRNILGMLAFFFSFLKLIIQNKPDVIHLHSSFAGLMGRIAILLSGRRHKTRVIYCPHAFGFLMQTSPIKKRIYSIAELFLANFTDKIICVSQSEYDSAVKAGFKKSKLVVIHNGVQIKSKSNTFTANNKTHYKLIFVGRFDYQKGIDILSEAIELLAKKNTNIFYEFTLIGEAVNSEDLIQFKDSKNIKINELGWLKPHQLEEQYLNHDALVIPSRWEGFAMVPLEAMSYGLPIIASNIEAFIELEDNEQPHMKFFKLNSESLSFCLEQIHTIDFSRNSQNSIKVFKRRYSEDLMNEATIKLYQF